MHSNGGDSESADLILNLVKCGPSLKVGQCHCNGGVEVLDLPRASINSLCRGPGLLLLWFPIHIPDPDPPTLCDSCEDKRILPPFQLTLGLAIILNPRCTFKNVEHIPLQLTSLLRISFLSLCLLLVQSLATSKECV